MELKDILSLVFSGIALIASGYTYIVHNRKLNIQQKQINEQEKQINDYQLADLEEKAAERKKAFIQCLVVDNSAIRKCDCLRIQNTGKAVARNVNFEIDDDGVIFNIDRTLFPYPRLQPGQSIDAYYQSFSNNIHQTIMFKWDDDFKDGESVTQVVSL